VASPAPVPHRDLRKPTLLLGLVAVGMFGFAFALVPLYDAFCEITGLNGRGSGRPAQPLFAAPAVDREVTIQFLAQVSKGMPWEFRPTETALRIRVGEMNSTMFYVRNRAESVVFGQAIPSVAPGFAAAYLQKTECFCFTRQQLEGGEEREMPVRFFVDPELPEEVHTLSLSYTIFRVDPEEVAGERG
jgi:cytochrome c oxidase assembly protein subunit 11